METGASNPCFPQECHNDIDLSLESSEPIRASVLELFSFSLDGIVLAFCWLIKWIAKGLLPHQHLSESADEG